jgi:DNA-binding transcriptional MerR regulator
MVIRELAQKTGVRVRTIRYYESIGLLPPPQRTSNNYRQYASPAVERLRFIASARSLGLSLNDISEILAARDKGIAPCQRILDKIAQHLNEIDRHIADLLTLRDLLKQLHTQGAILPLDDLNGENCICYLLKTYRDTGLVAIQKGEFLND